MSACAESGPVPMGVDDTDDADEPAESDVMPTGVDEADEADEAGAPPPAAIVSPPPVQLGKDAPFMAAAAAAGASSIDEASLRAA